MRTRLSATVILAATLASALALADSDAVVPQAPAGAARVSGHISTAAGAPYPEAWVEFADVFGKNVHTLTDANGDYSLAVPDGVYTALAGDDNDPGVSMSVLGDDNAIEVPGDEVVNFVADS